MSRSTTSSISLVVVLAVLSVVAGLQHGLDIHELPVLCSHMSNHNLIHFQSKHQFSDAILKLAKKIIATAKQVCGPHLAPHTNAGAHTLPQVAQPPHIAQPHPVLPAKPHPVTHTATGGAHIAPHPHTSGAKPHPKHSLAHASQHAHVAATHPLDPPVTEDVKQLVGSVMHQLFGPTAFDFLHAQCAHAQAKAARYHASDYILSCGVHIFLNENAFEYVAGTLYAYFGPTKDSLCHRINELDEHHHIHPDHHSHKSHIIPHNPECTRIIVHDDEAEEVEEEDGEDEEWEDVED